MVFPLSKPSQLTTDKGFVLPLNTQITMHRKGIVKHRTPRQRHIQINAGDLRFSRIFGMAFRNLKKPAVADGHEMSS